MITGLKHTLGCTYAKMRWVEALQSTNCVWWVLNVFEIFVVLNMGIPL